MKKFLVTLPVVGSVSVEVEAEDKADALEKAWEADFPSVPDEWDAVQRVTRGNVCYAPVNEAYAEEIKE